MEIQSIVMLKEISMLFLRPTSGGYFFIAFVCVLCSVSPTLAGSLDQLKQALKGNDVEVAWRAISGIPRRLTPLQKEETIKLLREALRKDWARCAGDVRQSIAIQLAVLDAKETIPDLLKLIRKNKSIEHECAECGCCFVSWSVNDTFLELEPDFFCGNNVLSALYSLATFSYAKAISDLVESKTAYKPELLIILGKIGHPRYAHFIAKFAVNENPLIRLAVANALGAMKQPSAIPVLGRLVEDSNESVRWAASQSLILIGGDRVIDTVKLKIHYPKEDIRALAARTLGVLGITEGLAVLRNLAREAGAPRARSLAIAYLGQLKDFESRPIFIAGLQDKSLLVRTYSIYSLGYVGGTSDIPLIEASLFEAKSIHPTPNDKEGLNLIDETTRESLVQIRSRPGGKGVGP